MRFRTLLPCVGRGCMIQYGFRVSCRFAHGDGQARCFLVHVGGRTNGAILFCRLWMFGGEGSPRSLLSLTALYFLGLVLFSSSSSSSEGVNEGSHHRCRLQEGTFVFFSSPCESEEQHGSYIFGFCGGKS